jgi:tetratricopeptide (TPR) repeat protein
MPSIDLFKRELLEVIRVRLTTVIWGSDFVDTFLRLTLRSLLAPGNVPALSAFCETGYTIYTTDEDRRLIEAAPLFAQLRQLVDMHITAFTTREIDASNFGSHSDLWVRGLDLARRNREVLFFIIPDIIYGDGTLLRWAERLQQGYRAIYSPGPQVVLETVYEEVARRFPENEQPIVLDKAQMHELLLRHLHPIPITMDRTSNRRTGHAEYDLRPVRGRGLVIRVLSSHPFCVDPSFFNELRSFNPCDHLDKLAFEDVTVASAEPLFKHVSWYYRPNRLGSADLDQLGFWWSSFSPPACMVESNHIYDIASRDDAIWRQERARAAEAGAFLRNQLAAASIISRLFLGLAQQGFSSAARFLAAASLVAVIRRRLVLRGDETLLIPCDGAFGGEAGASVWSLIAAGDVQGIVSFLRNHIVRYDGEGRAVTLNGKLVAEFAPEAKVLGGPKHIAGFRMFAVDQIFGSNGIEAVAQRDRRRALHDDVADPAAGRIMPGLHAALDDAPTLAFLPRSPAAPFEFETLPAGRRREQAMKRLSARVQQVTSKTAWRLLDRNRNLIRRTFLALSTIPWLRRPAAVTEQLLAYTYRHGLHATIVRIRVEFKGRVPTKLGPNRDAARLVNTAVPNYDWATIQDIDPGAPLADLQATAAVAVPTPANAHPPDRSSAEANAQISAALRAVRLLRGLTAIEDVLGPYETEVLTELGSSAPLALVRTLRRNWCGDNDDLRSVGETTLRDLLKSDPDCPEVLTELGFLLRDAGRNDEAMASLAASASSKRTTSSAVDARAKAATELGEMHAERGEFEQAAAALERAISLASVTSATYYRYGETLRRLGRISPAIEAFARAMNASHPTWDFPKAGRDARLIWLDLHATRPESR